MYVSPSTMIIASTYLSGLAKNRSRCEKWWPICHLCTCVCVCVCVGVCFQYENGLDLQHNICSPVFRRVVKMTISSLSGIGSSDAFLLMRRAQLHGELSENPRSGRSELSLENSVHCSTRFQKHSFEGKLYMCPSFAIDKKRFIVHHQRISSSPK